MFVCFVVAFARLLFFTPHSLGTFAVDGKDVGLVTGVDVKRGDDYGVGATWTPAWEEASFKCVEIYARSVMKLLNINKGKQGKQTEQGVLPSFKIAALISESNIRKNNLIYFRTQLFCSLIAR